MRRIQLKFRNSALTALDRANGRIFRRRALTLLAVYSVLPSSPAALALLVTAATLLQRRHHILTDYHPLAHLTIVRTNMTRQLVLSLLSLSGGRIDLDEESLQRLSTL